jgi:hypothetical protein
LTLSCNCALCGHNILLHHCRPAAELQVFMGDNGVRALELEWRLLLGMERAGRTITFSPCVSLIARKAAKIDFHAQEENSQRTGMRLNPGMLQGPSVTLVALPSDGPMDAVLAVSPLHICRAAFVARLQHASPAAHKPCCLHVLF